MFFFYFKNERRVNTIVKRTTDVLSEYNSWKRKKHDRCGHYECENLKQEWNYHSGKYTLCPKETGKFTIR